jgi:hypothetical protein
MSGEQCVFSGERHGPDGVLDRVRIQFEAAIWTCPILMESQSL